MLNNLEHKIKGYFDKKSTLTKARLVAHIHLDFPELKQSTINVYLSILKKKSVITSPSRGVYAFKSKQVFCPEVSLKSKRIFNKIKKDYPFIEVCVWNTKWLNEFMRHQMFQFYTIVEVDKEAKEAVFYALKEQGKQVFLEPDTETFNLYVNNNYNVIIVRPLISEAPLSFVENITVPSLEKLLVDMTIDTALFGSQRAELESIYENAFKKYQLNKNKMNRYALRRNRAQEVKRLVALTLAKIE